MAFPIPTSLKSLIVSCATHTGVYFVLAILSLIVSLSAAGTEVPLFRKAEKANVITPLTEGTTVRLLADADYPPFSFRAGNGQAAGLSVDLALLACAELKVTCSVDMRPFSELVPALLRGDGDVIVSGIKLQDKLLSTLAMTRPYFWSFGRFAARKDLVVSGTTSTSLQPFKIGFVVATGHAAFVQKYYADADLVPQSDQQALYTALKNGGIDIAFGDNLALTFWLAGSSSSNCCKPLGGPFVERDTISHNMAYLIRRDEASLLKALDMALDRLQENGSTSKLLERYFPASYW